MPANERDLEPCSERATRGYPALFCKLDLSQRSKPVQLFLLPISGRRPRETDGRARNWRARRFRVNAPASRPGRSRFAARLRRFATRVCVCGGLWRWARGAACPRHWPTVGRVLADCLHAFGSGASRDLAPRKVSGSRLPRPNCANSCAAEALRGKSGRRGRRKSRVMSRGVLLWLSERRHYPRMCCHRRFCRSPRRKRRTFVLAAEREV